MVEDILGFAKATLYAIGQLSAATIGAVYTGVAGLQISATGPASMSVIIGTGSIYETETVDSTAYSTLGTDSNLLYKQGFLSTPQTLTLTAPGTSGYSQNYLVQAGYADTDTGAIVPPYLDSANPLVPWAGANNMGGSQFTVRQGQLILGLKPGTAAPSGSQVTPSPDSGFVGLWQITVANTDTTITSSNWSRISPDPFAPPWFPNLQSLDGRYVRITTATTSPTSSSLGTTFYVNAATGSDTLYDGTSATIVGTTKHGPFATIQHAVNYLSQLQSLSPVTINVAAGTYGPVSINSSNIFSWTINGAGAGSCTIDGTGTNSLFIYGSQTNVTIGGFAFISTIVSAAAAQLTITGTNSLSIPAGTGFYAYGAAYIISSGAITITYTTGGGGASEMFLASGGGQIQLGFSGAVATFVASGSPKFNVGWAVANQSGVIFGTTSTMAFSGSIGSGSVRYHVTDNGTIATNGGGASFFPGTVAGTAQNTTVNYN
jgi:hypothetical protein